MEPHQVPVKDPTPARRKAATEYASRQKAAGVKAVTFRLSPETVARIDEIKATSGLSANEIINRAVAEFEPSEGTA